MGNVFACLLTRLERDRSKLRQDLVRLRVRYPGTITTEKPEAQPALTVGITLNQPLDFNNIFGSLELRISCQDNPVF